MKKVLVLAALALTIATSVVAGTLAVYNINLGTIAESSVIAKSFALSGTGSDSFSETVKIAPTESVTKVFTVTNAEDGVVTETKMEINIDVMLEAATDKTAIAPLTAKVLNSDGEEVGASTIVNGVGTISIDDTFDVDVEAQTNTYSIVIEWPSNNDVDTNFAGANNSTNLVVSVSGTQIQ